MEVQPCVFLGIKVKAGPIERHRIENYSLDNTIETLKSEAEKKTNIPSSSLEMIHHGKVLNDAATLRDSGIKDGEMVHVVKKKMQPPVETPQDYTDAELHQIVTGLRTFGCTPNAPGWTRAMQILNDESTMAEIVEAVPSLGEDCITLSILHEVELLAALGANRNTMRRGANARPDLPAAVRHLARLVVRSRSNSSTSSNEAVPTSGFAYSLEALSEDEDVEEEDNEEGQRLITQEQLTAALLATRDAIAISNSRNNIPAPSADDGNLIEDDDSANTGATTRIAASNSATATPSVPVAGGSTRAFITPEMFNEAMTQAFHRARSQQRASTPMEQSTAGSSSQSPTSSTEGYFDQLQRMHEMGLLDDALNMRALLICSGDVNAAINLVFSEAIGDE